MIEQILQILQAASLFLFLGIIAQLVGQKNLINLLKKDLMDTKKTIVDEIKSKDSKQVTIATRKRIR